MSLPTPNTRKEQYLNAIATGNAGGLPTPITREEEYLDAIAKGGGSGDGDMKKSVYDSDLDVAGAGGIKAFVNSAVAGKVDKVAGKGLSTNDYTDEDKAIVDGVTGALAEKADTDDIPDLVSDNLAKGILGNETVLSTDNVPFVSKIMSAGKYQRKKFVGCSFVWNQLANIPASDISKTLNGLTFTDNRDGSYSLQTDENGTTAQTNINMVLVSFKANHVYYLTGGDGNHCVIYQGNTSQSNSNGLIWKEYRDVARNLTCIVWSGLVMTQKHTFFPKVHDLTQLFGSTAIADYIYNLETATAGAGIAKLKELGLFTKDYYAYDAGSVQSVDIKEYSVLGGGTNLFGGKAMIKNALSVHGENVTVNETNDTVVLRATLMQTGYVITTFDKWALPNTQYTFMLTYSNHVNETNLGLVYTDGTIYNVPRVPASEYEIGKHVTTIFTSAPNKTISYLRGIWNNGISTLYADESGIFAKDTTEYEPYHKTTYPLTPTELRGVPRIDANNNIYCDGDEYASDGTVNRIYGERAYQEGDESLADAITDGTTTVYKLTTPTTETLTPFDYPQSVGSIEEIVDYKVEQEDRDVAIPTGHVTEYMGKGGEFTLPTLPDTPSVLAYDGHNFFWKPETA